MNISVDTVALFTHAGCCLGATAGPTLDVNQSCPQGNEDATSADATLRQLRYFAVPGEELNYRRAEERLFITQPALSTAIKQLEHQSGVALFTRNTLEVALTDEGRARAAGPRRMTRHSSTPSERAQYPRISQ